jgi:hypothetical protein
MNNKSNLVAYGLMSLALLFGLSLSVMMVKNKQDSRSSAAGLEDTEIIDEELVDGVCGSADGQIVDSKPSDEEACDIGAINWMDGLAEDGTYEWDCYGSLNGAISNCSADLSTYLE